MDTWREAVLPARILVNERIPLHRPISRQSPDARKQGLGQYLTLKLTVVR